MLFPGQKPGVETVALLLDSLTFGLAIAFIVIGLIGTVVPVLPGTLLVWITIVVYAAVTGMTSVGWGTLVFVTLIALVTGTADFWLPLLGARKTGAGGWSIVLGAVGGIIGTFILPLIGTIIGYGLGIVLGEVLRHRDLRLGLKAGLGGMAGWGVATAVQFAGAALMGIVFLWQALSG